MLDRSDLLVRRPQQGAVRAAAAAAKGPIIAGPASTG